MAETRTMEELTEKISIKEEQRVLTKMEDMECLHFNRTRTFTMTGLEKEKKHCDLACYYLDDSTLFSFVVFLLMSIRQENNQ